MDPPPLKLKRVEVGSKRPYYLAWPPDGRHPVKLFSNKCARQFLEREGLSGVVPLDSFDFKRSSTAQEESTSGNHSREEREAPLSSVFDDEEGMEVGNEDSGGGRATARPNFHLENILKTSADIEQCFKVDVIWHFLQRFQFVIVTVPVSRQNTHCCKCA